MLPGISSFMNAAVVVVSLSERESVFVGEKLLLLRRKNRIPPKARDSSRPCRSASQRVSITPAVFKRQVHYSAVADSTCLRGQGTHVDLPDIPN